MPTRSVIAAVILIRPPHPRTLGRVAPLHTPQQARPLDARAPLHPSALSAVAVRRPSMPSSFTSQLSLAARCTRLRSITRSMTARRSSRVGAAVAPSLRDGEAH